jgi:hypothetical protein
MIAAESTDLGLPAPDLAAAEGRLLALWAQILGKELSGRDDNIFEAGAQSLHVMMAVKHIHDALGREISPLLFFEAPTVATQARALMEETADSVI